MQIYTETEVDKNRPRFSIQVRTEESYIFNQVKLCHPSIAPDHSLISYFSVSRTMRKK